MKRIMARTVLLAALVGAWSAAGARGGPYMSSYYNKDSPDGCSAAAYRLPTVPGVVGPHGEPVTMAFPYAASPPNGEDAARAMLAQSVPYNELMGYMAQNGIPNPLLPGNGQSGGMSGMPMGGGLPGMNLSPTPAGAPMLPPGMMGLPSPGGLVQAGGAFSPGAGIMQTSDAMYNNGIQRTGAPATGASAPFPVQRTEVRFVGPAGMKVAWYTTLPDGKQGFGAQTLEVPGRYNFLQAAIYRLKLSDIPNRPGVELYPTLEVVPANSRTSTFLAHSAVPVNFTDEDFDQVAAGNFVVKVIYLPDPQFQDLASTGLAEVVSSQLDPGVNPIAEAQRRGSILLVVRLGNIDLEAPNTPAMDTPGPNRTAQGTMGQPPGAMQPPPNGMSRMVPYGYTGNPGGPAGPYPPRPYGPGYPPSAGMTGQPGLPAQPGYPGQPAPGASPGIPAQPGIPAPPGLPAQPGSYAPPWQFSPQGPPTGQAPPASPFAPATH